MPRPRIELGTHGFSVHCSTELSYLGVKVIVSKAGELSSGQMLTFDARKRQALHDVTLGQDKKDHNRHNRQSGCRHLSG